MGFDILGALGTRSVTNIRRYFEPIPPNVVRYFNPFQHSAANTKDFFSKCEQIRNKQRICSHVLTKSFIFWAVILEIVILK